MTVQTATGVPVLDSGDFQTTTNGVTWGLKLRYVATPDGAGALDLFVIDPAGPKPLILDFGGALQDVGVTAYMTSVLIPKVNDWFKTRFGGGSTTTPPPSVPQMILDLDKALKALTATATGVK